MIDWGNPELIGVSDALDPEFLVTQSGGFPGTPPVRDRIYVCRVNEVEIGRYLCQGSADVAGYFRTYPDPPDTVTFNYINLDGVSNAALFDSLAFPSVGRVDWHAVDQPTGPSYELGALDVFATPAELRAALGAVTDTNRLAVALLVATRWVLHRMGYGFADPVIPPDPAALVVNPVAVRSSWRQATIAAAVRFYRSPEVPFGVAGGWDMATYVRMSIPDVDLLLLGQRERFGIA